jgi:hypothetical protein
MQADDQFVAVVLVLVCAGLDGEVRVAPGDPGKEEVDHGPQLLQGVLQRSVDEEQPLLTGTHTYTQKYKLNKAVKTAILTIDKATTRDAKQPP